jgi:hypothetical protein
MKTSTVKGSTAASFCLGGMTVMGLKHPANRRAAAKNTGKNPKSLGDFIEVSFKNGYTRFPKGEPGLEVEKKKKKKRETR